MNKIAMITFHASHNNGSMLQALALQTALEKNGCDVEIVNFSNEGQRNLYAPLPTPHNWKQCIKWLIWASNYKELKRQHAAYDAFLNKYFKLTNEEYHKTEQLSALNSNYDAFVTGSDQVWNIKCIDADDAYFLSFVKDKPKFAYAVSLGANNAFDGEQGEKYTAYIRDFTGISVREKNAQKWIKQATGETYPIALDPTMLFDAEDWEKIVQVKTEPIIKGKYIFYYCFGINEEVQKFLHRISDALNIPVYFIEAKEWTLKTCWRHKIRLVKEYGPDVYLNLVKHADLFITSSFHGTAFGTIYRKNFWYIKSKDSESSMDDRAVTFLSQLGLMSRYRTIEELMNCDLYEQINYAPVVENIETLRETSKQYIESMIGKI
ncbi:MAG: polysaccharide pyruvyl transferase family protein [Ruminococcaceae bacterium]|nr:polysaccharide pyruvyl transferase family protein [Oscillospiraceae bacterium]